jgi:hypothetical protein
LWNSRPLIHFQRNSRNSSIPMSLSQGWRKPLTGFTIMRSSATRKAFILSTSTGSPTIDLVIGSSAKDQATASPERSCHWPCFLFH